MIFGCFQDFFGPLNLISFPLPRKVFCFPARTVLNASVLNEQVCEFSTVTYSTSGSAFLRKQKPSRQEGQYILKETETAPTRECSILNKDGEKW